MRNVPERWPPFTYVINTNLDKLESMCSSLMDKPKLPNRAPRNSFIYILWHENEIVYVGQTTSTLWSRLQSHNSDTFQSRLKIFDSYSFIEVELVELDDLEMYLICKFRPKYNRTGIDADLILPDIDPVEARTMLKSLGLLRVQHLTCGAGVNDAMQLELI